MILGVILQTLGLLITIVQAIVISQFVLYLLLTFNVVNYSNNLVATLWNFLSNILNPILEPIRQRLPPAGGIDFSYMVLLFGLIAVRWLLVTITVVMYQWLAI